MLVDQSPLHPQSRRTTPLSWRHPQPRARTNRSALSSAMKLAVARVGKRPKNNAGAFINRPPDIHGEGENQN